MFPEPRTLFVDPCPHGSGAYSDVFCEGLAEMFRPEMLVTEEVTYGTLEIGEHTVHVQHHYKHGSQCIVGARQGQAEGLGLLVLVGVSLTELTELRENLDEYAHKLGIELRPGAAAKLVHDLLL